MSPYVVAVVIVLAYVAYRLFGFVRRVKREVAAAHKDYLKRRGEEEDTLEDADWIGRTGLDEASERELPRYLRREFGEFLDDPEGLKARDLEYLGVYTDAQGAAHFWRIPQRAGEEACFAYVDIDERGEACCYGWGGREPGTAVGSANAA